MKLLGLAGLITALGCSQGVQYYPNPLFCDQAQEYDDDTANIDKRILESILHNTYELDVKMHFTVTENGQLYNGSVSGGGTGYALNNGYMFTAKHVLNLSLSGITNARPSAFVVVDYTEVYAVKNGQRYKLEIDYQSIDKDFAVLKGDLPVPSIYLTIGYSYELEEGDAVYVFSGENYPYIKEGEALAGAWQDGDAFYIEGDFQPGDSGGIVVGFRSGCPELLGIVSRRSSASRTEIVRIESIIKGYEGLQE